MSMYGYDLSLYDYGFSDQSVTNSIYGHSFPPMGASIDYDDEIYARRRPPLRSKPPSKPTISSPPKQRHDGTSPLPLGMDWSLPPRIWEGRNSVWPVDLHKGWSYCLTFPSWTIIPSASGSDTVFFGVQVGIQSPEGITTTRGVQRRFNEFLKLYSELKQEFPKKDLPPPPPRRLMKMRSKKLLEERMSALEGWMQKLLSDIHVSRTAPVAIFLELEAAARQACCELNQDELAENLVPTIQSPSNSNSGLRSSLGDDSQEPEAEVLQDDLSVALLTERERSSSMQCDMEELRGKCMQLELKLTTEQDARAYAESMKTTIVEQNEMLLKELDDAKEQIENLRKQKNEVELKSKSDIEVLDKEIKSLGTSHSELKQELSKCLEEKVELEKEKQKWEGEKATKVALLHECELLRNRLQECRVNFLDEEDKLTVDTSVTDAMDLLETFDSQIGLLLAEARKLAETAATPTNQDDDSDIPINRDDGLRTLLGGLLTDNVKLRKQVNSVIRHTLSKPGNSLMDDDGM